MKASSKPAGYSAVSPYLVIKGAQQVVDFLKKTFDATELRRYARPDGSIMHVEVKIDDSVIMIADANEQYSALSSWMHVYVSDVDATYRRALAAGGVAVEEPTQRPGDPDRRGGVKDPGGNTWWVSTQTE